MSLNRLRHLLNKQTSVLDNRRRHQVSHLNREIEKINTGIQKIKRKEGEINDILLQLPSATFVKQCKEFLKKHDSTQMEPESPLPSWRKPVFIPPPLSPDSDEFLEFSQNNILGYFADEEGVRDYRCRCHSAQVIPSGDLRNEDLQRLSSRHWSSHKKYAFLQTSMTVTSVPSQESSGQSDESW